MKNIAETFYLIVIAVAARRRPAVLVPEILRTVDHAVDVDETGRFDVGDPTQVLQDLVDVGVDVDARQLLPRQTEATVFDLLTHASVDERGGHVVTDLVVEHRHGVAQAARLFQLNDGEQPVEVDGHQLAGRARANVLGPSAHQVRRGGGRPLRVTEHPEEVTQRRTRDQLVPCEHLRVNDVAVFPIAPRVVDVETKPARQMLRVRDAVRGRHAGRGGVVAQSL